MACSPVRGLWADGGWIRLRRTGREVSPPAGRGLERGVGGAVGGRPARPNRRECRGLYLQGSAGRFTLRVSFGSTPQSSCSEFVPARWIYPAADGALMQTHGCFGVAGSVRRLALFKRSIPAVVLFCGSLLLGSPTFADEADLRTARSLYQQFLQQVEAEQYQQALETYRRIDAVQLSREEQTRLHETALNIDRRIQGDRIDPADLLRQAEADLAAGRFGPASARFGQVLESNTATERQQAAAEAGLATATRRLSAGLEQARQQIADAEAALARGQVDVARNLLNQVRNSGLALGRFDSRHLQNLMSRVEEIDRQAGRPMPTVAANGNGNGNGAPAARPAPQLNGWDDEEAELPQLADVGTTDGNGAADVNGNAAGDAQPPQDDEMVNLRRAQSQRLVEEGLQALGEGRHFATNEIPNPRRAIEKFRAALQVDPSNQAAAEQLQRVQRDFGMVTSARDLSEVQVEAVRLEVQRILAEFEDRMEAARRALMADNFAAAARAAIEARQTLDRSPHIPRDQYGRFVQRASDLSIQIDNRREQFEAERREAVVSEQERLEQRVAIEGEDRRREEINRALTLANRYRLQQRYDEAIEQVQQALFIDPQNLPARFFLDALEESRNLARVRDLRRTRDKYIQLHSVENLEASIPWTENITFPSDWRELSHRRWRMWGDFETDDDRRTLERMRQIRFTLGSEPRPFNDVLDELRRESGLNIIVMASQIQDEAFVSPADIEVAGPWTRTMERALESILAEVTPDGSVSYEIVDGDIIISTRNFFRQRNSRIETYDVRDLIAPPPNYTGPELNPGITGNRTGTGTGGGAFGLFGGAPGGGGGGGFGGTAEGISAEESIAQLRELIQNTVGDNEDWDDFGGGDAGRIEERQGLLIIRTTPSNHREIRGLLSMLRSAQTDQIHLEGRFITVDQGFLEDIGVDLDVNLTSTSAWGDVTGEDEDGESIVAQRLGMTQNSFGMTARGTDSISGLPGGQALSLGAVAGFMDDVEVTFLLRATQASRRAVNLESPRLTFSNGQQAFISVATSTSFVGNLSPVSGAGGADTDVETADEGFVFQVRGTISADKRFVTLDLNPQISTVDLSNTQRVPVFSAAGTGVAGDDGSVQAAQDEVDITLPRVTQTSLSTTVTVPDRGSLLMGGQRIVRETEIEVGVPILSKIPVLNRLFSNTRTSKGESTLLILVKPTILIMDEMEEDNFPGILESRRSYGIGQPIN